MNTRELELAARLPFDFQRSLSFLCSFGPTRGEQSVDGASFTKAFVHRGVPLVARISRKNSADRLSATIFSERPLDDAFSASVVERLRFQLGLDDDLEGFYDRARADRPFAHVVRELHGQRHVKFGSGPFEALCWAVLVQRLRIPIARTIKDRLVAELAPAIEVEGVVHRPFPEPAALLRAGFAGLDRHVRNEAKTAALLAIAEAFSGIDERFLREAPYDDVEAWLQRLPRIGPWSSSFVLFRALGRTERFPVDHMKPLAEAVRRVYGVTGSDRTALARGDAYGEHRGYWSYYLRIAA